MRQYLPDLRLADEEVASTLTLRHLVTHTGGWWGDFFDDFGPGDDALARYVAAMATLPQIVPLGAFFGYNNAGFSLAGRVIEAVTDQTYEAAVTELVLAPLGMDTACFFAAEAITYSVAVGHDGEPGAVAVVRPWPIPRGNNPAGGVIASTRQMLDYARFHLAHGANAGGEALLSPAAMRQMQTPLGPGSSELEGVGVSWLLRRVGGARVVEHGGATSGQQSAFLMVPERGFAFVLHTNANAGAILGIDLGDWVLERYLGLRNPAPSPIAVSATALEAYAGEFSAPSGEGIRFAVQNGVLVGTLVSPDAASPAGEPLPFTFVDQDAAIVSDGDQSILRGDFLRADDGTVSWFRVGGRIVERTG